MMTLTEKILAAHSGRDTVHPGEIVDVEIDVRAARDFGGANVVKNIRDKGLIVKDPARTIFTFDCNPTGSDQKYAVNQHICRLFARENSIRVYDIDSGIGTHLLIDRGYVFPGVTAVSTDSHANILGAVGAFGQGMGDLDIAASWHNGRIWFKVPPSVMIQLTGAVPADVTAKDIALNLLGIYGANSLLGYSVELYGDCVDHMSLDSRITISSMATEMGAITILFPPSGQVIDYCSSRAGRKITPLYADNNASYEKTREINVTGFKPMVSMPGAPHNTVAVSEVEGLKIDSAFIGSCTNGRMEDLQAAAGILKGRSVAPGVMLKIVPATDEIWKECLNNGFIDLFKKSGALVSNAGCAGCAAGQVGQNGPGEVTVSTGNRNFPGKQGKGSVYLASPAVAAASAVAGYLTTPGKIPEKPARFISPETKKPSTGRTGKESKNKPDFIEGRVWIIDKDNIDTDMIFHNRYLAITDAREMGQYAFDNLKGYEDFAKKVGQGDIVITGKNFGSGSSRQQAVDCFISLGLQGIIARSFGAIYERNAINAAFPVIVCKTPEKMDMIDGDIIRADLRKGTIINMRNNKETSAEPFSDIQFEIYQKGGLI